MDKIQASVMARRFGDYLERVVAGESFEVLRYGRVVARLTPTGPPAREAVVPQVQKATAPSTDPRERQAVVDQVLRDSRKRG